MQIFGINFDSIRDKENEVRCQNKIFMVNSTSKVTIFRCNRKKLEFQIRHRINFGIPKQFYWVGVLQRHRREELLQHSSVFSQTFLLKFSKVNSFLLKIIF